MLRGYQSCLDECNHPETYLVDWFHDPIDSGIATYGFMLRIHKNDLEVLVGRILVDPVGVQYSKICATTANPFFRG